MGNHPSNDVIFIFRLCFRPTPSPCRLGFAYCFANFVRLRHTPSPSSVSSPNTLSKVHDNRILLIFGIKKWIILQKNFPRRAKSTRWIKIYPREKNPTKQKQNKRAHDIDFKVPGSPVHINFTVETMEYLAADKLSNTTGVYRSRKILYNFCLIAKSWKRNIKGEHQSRL